MVRPVQRAGRTLGGAEQIHPPHRAVERDRHAGIDRPLRLRPVDQAQFQSHSPLRGFLSLIGRRVDEKHVTDDDTQGFESERCEHVPEGSPTGRGRSGPEAPGARACCLFGNSMSTVRVTLSGDWLARSDEKLLAGGPLDVGVERVRMQHAGQ